MNVGQLDRVLRVLLGITLIALALADGTVALDGTYEIVAIVAGVIMLGTATLRFCPLYRLLGVRTCRAS